MTAVVGARNLFNVDAGVVHALLQARYYDGSKGEFLSEDPVFLGDPKQQVLTDPQSLNSYSYANDNPITKSDPTGLDAYYNNSGQKVFSDNRTNGVFSEAGDTAMLSSNVRSVTSGNAASNFANWLNSVRNGGAWDYKTPANNGGRGYYFFNGKLVNANDFGNMNYGYTGAAFGIGANVLVDAAGVVEGYDVGRTNNGITLTNVSGNFNAPGNTAGIRVGINAFNTSQFSNTLSRTSQAVSNAGYSAASAPILARLTTVLLAAAQTLKALAGK